IPAVPFEEDDTEREQQSPVGNIGHDMSTGKALTATVLKNLNQARTRSWTVHKQLNQKIQQETYRRQNNDEQRFQSQTQTPEDQRSHHDDRGHEQGNTA